MATTLGVRSAEDCADRVRAMRRILFGNTQGNKYRSQISALRELAGQLGSATRNTKVALIDAVFEDPETAALRLASIARTRPHGAIIFIALDLAIHCLMNPERSGGNDQWVSDISETYDKPIALVLRCLEWLENTAG